jgi:hypothetical protein
MRNVGRIALECSMNHTKELAAIEVISRCAKLLIRDGLTVLAETSAEELGAYEAVEGGLNRFTSENVKKCILHYIHEIFKIDGGPSVTTIWDFLTEHSRRKFQMTIERDSLVKV